MVNAVVDMADGELETVTITEDNFEELQDLCRELGFRGLDRELQKFKVGHVILREERLDEYEEMLEDFETELVGMRDTLKEQVEDHEYSLAELKEQIKQHEQLFQEVQRRLNELETGKTKEPVPGQIQSLERKVEAVARVSEERNVELLEKIRETLIEFAKPIDEVIEDVAQLNASHETEKTKSEESRVSVSGQIQSLERKVGEVARVCEERNVELSQKMGQALLECGKRLEELIRDVAQLKENEKKAATKPPVTAPATAPAIAPVAQAKPALPTLGKTREFVYRSSKPLRGVIAYLTRECGGNVHDRGIVNVTASSASDYYHPKNAVDLGTNSIYYSNNEMGTWICYDFKERRVIPKSYSVRSCGSGPGGYHLKSWVIEVQTTGPRGRKLIVETTTTT